MKNNDFPMDTLPKDIANYCTEVADVISVEPAMVVCSLLPIMSGLIGASRTVTVKDGHEEPAIIWVLIVAKSGRGKSPVMRELLKGLNEIENNLEMQFSKQLSEYNCLNKKERIGIPEPKRESLIISDTTIEGLAQALSDNPSGLIIHRDEASGLFGSFGKYSGAKGADESIILELFNGDMMKSNRKDAEKNVYVNKPVASIIGGIQPSKLGFALKEADWTSGLAARFLIYEAQGGATGYSTKTISGGAKNTYTCLVHELYSLHTKSQPKNIRFSKKALDLYVRWFNKFLTPKIDKADEALSASLSKMGTYVPRIALVLQCCDNPNVTVISWEVLGRAIKIGDWFVSVINSLHNRMSEFTPKVSEVEILQRIECDNGFISPRDLVRVMKRKFKDTHEARRRLLQLTKEGKLQIVRRDGVFGFELIY